MKYMQEAVNSMAYGKIGIYGDAKSGKTRTATEIAIGLHKFIGSKKPIAMFDTEPGHQYMIPLYKKAGIKFYAYDKSRAFVDLMGFTQEAAKETDIMIADSISHVWRELCEAYLKRINEDRIQYRKKPITRLEMHHYQPIKAEWRKFTDLYLNSKLHIIVCGRAGSIFEYQVNEETGKKELITVGTKMSTEKEMGYEPSLLIEMKKIFDPSGDRHIINRALVEGDRADLFNGKEFDFPTFENFRPHFEYLNIGGNHFNVDDGTSKDLFTPDGNDGWTEEKRNREILSEEIAALFTKHMGGKDAETLKKKILLLEKHLGTSSKTKIESMKSAELREGYLKLKAHFEPNADAEPEPLSEEEAKIFEGSAANV